LVFITGLLCYQTTSSADGELGRSSCDKMSVRVTSEAIQADGGYGFTDEYPVCRLYPGRAMAAWAAGRRKR